MDEERTDIVGRLGVALFTVGMLAGAVVWWMTVAHFYQANEIGMVALAFLLPPLDVILAFQVSTELGLWGLGATALLLAGAAMG